MLKSLAQFIIDNTDGLVAAANFTVVVFMAVLCVSALYLYTTRKFSESSVAPYLILGAAVESAGWVLHRGYWGAWRYFRSQGDKGWDAWFVANGYLALIPSAMVLVGLSMLLTPLWTLLAQANTQSCWRDYTLAAAAVFGVYWFILLNTYDINFGAFVRPYPVAITHCDDKVVYQTLPPRVNIPTRNTIYLPVRKPNQSDTPGDI